MFVCPVCIKVIGEEKNNEMLYISLSATFIKNVNNFNKTDENILSMLNPNFAVLNLSYVEIYCNIIWI